MFKQTRQPLCAAFGAFLLFAMSGSAHAGVIIGGSSILDNAGVNQLESWLGEGPLKLTNIFTKDANDPNKNDSRDWHRDVDGRGRTFSVWEVRTSNGQGGVDNFIFGGYNPQSWRSNYSWNFTDPDADRTAFIFNLSTGVKLDQCKSTDSAFCGNDNGNLYGRSQTYNDPGRGPSFGGGHDLYVDANLSNGYNYAWSYGLSDGENLPGFIGPDGQEFASPLDNDHGKYYWMSVGALETFTIEPHLLTASSFDLPEPATITLLSFGLAGLGLAARRKLGA